MVSILNGVLPVFAIIALGVALRRLRVIDDAFLVVSDRLIYYIFFPALLFWKIGKPTPEGSVEWVFIGAVMLSVLTVFVASLVFVRASRMPSYAVGSFCQGCYRFSTYIGMAAVMAALGEDGVRRFGILIGFVIPFINVLAVSTLIWFSGEEYSQGRKAALLVKAMVSNPLIVACLMGLLYSRLGTPFPIFVDNILSLMSMLALPLALISIGGSLRFSAFAGHLRYSLMAASFKLLLLPAVGYAILHLLQVSHASFQVAMIYCALPTSPANYILSTQLNSDVDLATSSILVSTLLSIGSLSLALILFVG